MKKNIKVQIALSVNPSFNFDFIDRKVYHNQFPFEQALMTHFKLDTEQREQRVQLNPHNSKHQNQKSEPAQRQSSAEFKASSLSRLLDSDSDRRMKHRSFSIKKMKTGGSILRSRQRILPDLKIDSLHHGSPIKVKNYVNWFKN